MSNETLKCPKCESYWECDIAEVELNEYEFATGSKDCPSCVEITNTMDLQIKRLFESTNSVLWGMTHVYDQNHRTLSKETGLLMDEVERALEKLRASLKRDIYVK